MSIHLDHSYIDALATTLVGLVAFWSYFYQKRDFKRDKAALILQEIRFADELCRQSNNNYGFHFYSRLLPTDTWNPFRNLFVHDFDSDELDQLTIFYARARDIDVQMDAIVSQMNDANITIALNTIGTLPPNYPLEPNGTVKKTHSRIADNRTFILNDSLVGTQIWNKLVRLSLPLHKRIFREIRG